MSLQVHIARFLIGRPVPMVFFFNFAHVFHTEGSLKMFEKLSGIKVQPLCTSLPSLKS